MVDVMTTINGLDVHYTIVHPKQQKTIVLLHGFTGSSTTWQQLMAKLPANYRIIALDLIGHGLSAAPKQVQHYTMEEQVSILHTFFQERQISTATVIGYSMGGRVALAFAMQYPECIDKLILESASPGLAAREDREVRMQHDELLAARITEDGIEAFVDYWQDLALFTSQKTLPIQMQQAIRTERLQQSACGLANSLRGMGTGQQKSYWSSLSQLSKPVVLLVGELDTKFCSIAEKMAEHLLDSTVIKVSRVGHAIHVENPESFATIIKDQL
ncbi:2-succinyl-6-hydroxy-2,4-cyclohexadiene-1-carboxylate synthase [Kurthia sibirica]|uniref:Putative 2-succinyl-6-hydroxy-2,4-cyclohexadiene-1-carboxylate synthase n=1 Tax=Kurthia sibirica TaxID=202750 RepID=A0A2U3AJT7_9BACL|nr:2-succinyl-6-hydroxy-2,4-cyclohexadiene-1-carboxylate synthase [Kurthia sibirica]PWI24799.1 2-succinyl-6-hydroxy-2,4-cyclohexadiene-1-carboxylate synthase [Kurthia sibirica]GEK35579.1 putative 2-succinyl-6-hydroxy-2,4-cyclohexadiene-1-carboxylate synthase [Kurthia sibirica]